jgi:hypothetical protein
MTSITNEDDLSFRQAVEGFPFHLCVHFHLGTLPNRKVSPDADGQTELAETLIDVLTSLEPGRLGESPGGCRQGLCATRESSNLNRENSVRDLITFCVPGWSLPSIMVSSSFVRCESSRRCKTIQFKISPLTDSMYCYHIASPKSGRWKLTFCMDT